MKDVETTTADIESKPKKNNLPKELGKTTIFYMFLRFS